MILPLEPLFDSSVGKVLPLSSALSAFYGSLRFPSHPGRPHVISNFVSTLDGVVSLDAQGGAVGDVISGSNIHDSILMGLLRAAADVVMVGAGTLHASPTHIWTPEHVYPPYAADYRELRVRMGRGPAPLNVIVTARGEVDLSLPVFTSGKVPVLIVTTAGGALRIKKGRLPESVRVLAAGAASSLTPREIIDTILSVSRSCTTILMEGGPRLMGDFIAGRSLDELFLTSAPQVAGRQGSDDRSGFVAGRIFAPEHPEWGTLLSVKRGGSHLFLRYAFEPSGPA